ncbi:MAG: carboxypeptidase regulatory-like domain-containing protein [Thermoanaerobaculia bacterium]
MWFALFAVAATMRAGGVSPPDLTKGNVGGKKAIIAYALSNVQDVEGPGARFDAILEPPDCEVHLGPFGNLEQELIYPCSAWFVPPNGRYRIWLETTDRISLGFGQLTWEIEPFTGRGMALGMGLEPAGRVALEKSVSLPETASFRIAHLRGVHGGKLWPLVDRRASAELARSGVPSLAGPTLAGIFDRRSGDAIALAKPVSVPFGKTVFVAPAPPAKGSDVLAILDRPFGRNPGEKDLALRLAIDAKQHPPDALVEAADAVVAVWYGVEGRKATLRAESKALHLAPVDLVLRPGRVTTHRGKLTVLPALGVSILSPEGVLDDVEITAELRLADASEALQTKKVSGNGEFGFEGAPAERVDVVLIAGAWEFRQSVDLTSGRDAAVAFDLVPFVISGTVFHGRDPAAGAEVAFQADRDWIRTTADDAGLYKVIVWRRDAYIAEVRVPSGTALPFVDGPFEVQDSRTIDFRVPNTRFEVTVIDAISGKPVVGAKVSAASMFTREQGEHNVVQTATTDDRGRASLPPMRPGAMTIRARADGYFDSAPERATVEAEDEERSYEIALRPTGETVRVLIRREDGRPASRAEVWAVERLSGQQPPLWRAFANDDGAIDIPRAVRSALFLVRADHSASAVRRLGGAERGSVWTLGPSAAPLRIRTSRGSRVAVWLDGERVSGVPLAFLSRSVEATDSDGIWSTDALHPEPLRILSWRTASGAAIESGAYDVLASVLDYPWPPVVELRPVD